MSKNTVNIFFITLAAKKLFHKKSHCIIFFSIPFPYLQKNGFVLLEPKLERKV
jgi:hypothetical protein